jgi:CheY-like chemotaxis protein
MIPILVVDDERAIVEMLQMFLEEEGYQVITAHNGEEGLRCLEAARPAVILCDLMMPVLDGRQMCQRLQSDQRYRSIPFVLMSAVVKAVNSTDCHYSALLTKPFNLDDVLSTVMKLVRNITS